MKVRVEAGGRIVEIECSDANATPRDIMAEALAAWKATEGARTGAGPAIGLQAQVASAPPAVVGFQSKPLTVTSEAASHGD